jgi:hypothetical protein
VHPMYESLWQDKEFKKNTGEGEAYKPEIRARIEELVAKENW